MRLAILSDTHSRHATSARALELVRSFDVDLILHCGDIDNVETVELFPSHTHFVFGNCDTDRDELRRAMRLSGATLHEPFGHIDLNGISLAFIHGDDSRMLRDLESSAAFRFIFYGHTHVLREHTVGSTRVINPGALHRAQTKTFLILDLPTEKMETVVVE